MSTFPFKAKSKARRSQDAIVLGVAIDDYFGNHIYGYRVEGKQHTMRAETFQKRYDRLKDEKLSKDEVNKAFNLLRGTKQLEEDELSTANVLDAIAAMTNDDVPESLEDVQAREFIITDSCAWEANRKAGAFHPHSIEVVDTVTGQIRHIASGAKIKFVEGGITSSRTQAEYNHMHKE